jgi:hypothetical protein
MTTDQELTRIYNEANGIGEGKSPPITTQRIFTAMRAAQAKALRDAGKKLLLTQSELNRMADELEKGVVA